MKKGKNFLIPTLIAVAIIFVVVLSYFLIIKPSISGYAIKMQQQGIQYAVLTIMQEASTCKPVPLYAGNINMSLMWTECLNYPSK
jgi:hypothetical protein